MKTEKPIAVLIPKINNNIERAVNIADFYDYVNGFYNNVNGLYPIATYEQIADAVWEHIKDKDDEALSYLDSVDREFVRKILEPEYQF